jgi:pantoate--beta-alanine ligase
LKLQDITDPLAMRAWSREARAAGRTVGFVPTMGYLHEGHLRLVDRAAERCDLVVMSIFVNPLQFGPKEDFSSYPRDLARDRALAAERGVDALFVPADGAMYPRPAIVKVNPGSLAAHLCGPWRPGHFEGVATVVAKLFNVVEPDVAVFGRKDAQQAKIITRMVEDLNMAVEIVVAPTTREADGLALSSRNTYLTPAQRSTAVRLSRALDAAHQRFRSGTTAAADVLAVARNVLEEDPAITIQYVEAVHPDTLAPVTTVAGDTIVAMACVVGKTRLIDNIVLGAGLHSDDRLAG